MSFVDNLILPINNICYVPLLEIRKKRKEKKRNVIVLILSLLYMEYDAIQIFKVGFAQIQI